MEQWKSKKQQHHWYPFHQGKKKDMHVYQKEVQMENEERG